jgi:Bacterial regulatory helix-turn-helix protein, lysR family
MVEPMATHRMGAGDLDLGLLRTFLTLVGSGSLGKTAASIDKTQSAVSQQMLRLEKIVGQKLFTRGRDGITLTRPLIWRNGVSAVPDTNCKGIAYFFDREGYD